jgi:small ligand-binding sensory domain FIST
LVVASTWQQHTRPGCQVVIFLTELFSLLLKLLGVRMTSPANSRPTDVFLCFLDPQMVGGVTESDAWLDTENSYGAVFCNHEVHCTGAVGCIFHGPLVMRQMLLPGCRSAGDIKTITEAVDTVIYRLDDIPVHNSVCGSQHPLPL